MNFTRDRALSLICVIGFTLISFCAYCEARFYKSIEVKKLFVTEYIAGMVYFKNAPLTLISKEKDIKVNDVYYFVVFKMPIQNFPQVAMCNAKTSKCFDYTEEFAVTHLNTTFNRDKSKVNLYAWFVKSFRPEFYMY